MGTQPWPFYPRRGAQKSRSLTRHSLTFSCSPGLLRADLKLCFLAFRCSLGLHPFGCGSKLNRRGYAGFGPRFHLPGFHFGTGLFEPHPFVGSLHGGGSKTSKPKMGCPGQDLRGFTSCSLGRFLASWAHTFFGPCGPRVIFML